MRTLYLILTKDEPETDVQFKSVDIFIGQGNIKEVRRFQKIVLNVEDCRHLYLKSPCHDTNFPGPRNDLLDELSIMTINLIKNDFIN